MPVWHELTRPWREDGRLTVIGITQEQHPERCRLFAQWQGFDWPILWDPLNLTGATAVPNLYALDEGGWVRSTRPNAKTFESDFLDATFVSLPAEPREVLPVARALVHGPEVGGEGDERVPRNPTDVQVACSHLLWGSTDDLEGALETLESAALAAPRDATLAFRLGVAYRLRSDSPLARLGDFQAALDSWTRALSIDPNQYIWRRRIQQYGPRLDKPYPFYDWVERAEREIAERGEQPLVHIEGLTGSELAGGVREFEAAQEELEEPDPQGRIARDEKGLVRVETAVTFDTQSARRSGPPTARVHVGLRPNDELAAHWNNEAEPLQVWIALPEGWQADRLGLSWPNPSTAVTNEVRRLDFELRPPGDAAQGPASTVLKGYALFNACEDVAGQCVFLRRDFEFEVALPR